MSENRHRRRLAAILAADVVGYTRAMAEDETGTLAQLQVILRDVIVPSVSGQDGRVFKEMGDGILAEFPSAIRAAQCAIEIQTSLAALSSPLALRIGLHVGDVIVEGGDLFGDGINIAARLQSQAEAGGVVVSEAFRGHAEGRAGLFFDDMGTRQLKNIAEPMRVHLLRRGGVAPVRTVGRPLRRLGLVVAVITTLGLTTLWAITEFGGERGPINTEQASITSAIAVLPFENLSQNPEQAYFADGLAEDLIIDLSKIEGIQVISRTSSFAYRDRVLSVSEIATRLKVRYVVEGSVRRAGDQLRITASLIDTNSDTPAWSDRFDGSVVDVFGFQDRITSQIIEALRVELTPAERRAVRTRGTNNLAAYDAYLRGMRLVAARRRLDTNANAAAQAAFEDAIRQDPDYALAYAGLAWTKWLYYESISYYSDASEAFATAKKSISIADNALAHRTLANKHFSLLVQISARDAGLAATELEMARRLQPNDADVLADLAIALCFSGRPDEALSLARKAMDLNPNFAAWYFAASGIAYLLTRQPELAIRDLKQWSAADPTWSDPYMFLAAAYGLAGDVEAATAAFDRHTHLLNGQKMSAYAVKRRWPMKPAEEAAFLRGLRVAGVEGAVD